MTTLARPAPLRLLLAASLAVCAQLWGADLAGAQTVQCSIDEIELPEGYVSYTGDNANEVDLNEVAYITCADGYWSPSDHTVLNVTCDDEFAFLNYTFGISPAPSDVPTVACQSNCYGYTCDFWLYNNANYNCPRLEEDFGCDCKHCICGVSGGGGGRRGPAPSTTTSTTTTTTAYRLKDGGGLCVDYRMCPLESSSQCAEAAVALGLSFTAADTIDLPSKPLGCFTTATSLTYNRNLASKTKATASSQVLLCQPCPKGYFPAPSTSTTTTTTSTTTTSTSTTTTTTTTSTTSTTTKPLYAKVNGGGVCKDIRYCPIMVKADCQAAAKALNNPDTTTTDIDKALQATGCFATQLKELRLNLALNTNVPTASTQTLFCKDCGPGYWPAPDTTSTTTTTKKQTTKKRTTTKKATTTTTSTTLKGDGSDYSAYYHRGQDDFIAVTTGGFCSDYEDYCSVGTLAACNEGAAFLKLPDTVAEYMSKPIQTHGCFTTPNKHLKFNDGVGVWEVEALEEQTLICTLCTVPAPSTTTKSTTTTTSTSTTTTTTKAPLFKFTGGGFCQDFFYCPIVDPIECGVVAKAMGFTDTVPDLIAKDTQVSGCYLTSANALKTNTAQNTGIAAGSTMTMLCELCPVGYFPAPSTTTTTGDKVVTTTKKVVVTTKKITTTTKKPRTTTTTTKLKPFMLKTGVVAVCTDYTGYCVIGDQTTCQAASAYLSQTDTIADALALTTQTAGCYLTTAKALKFNSILTSTIYSTTTMALICVRCATTAQCS